LSVQCEIREKNRLNCFLNKAEFLNIIVERLDNNFNLLFILYLGIYRKLFELFIYFVCMTAAVNKQHTMASAVGNFLFLIISNMRK
jgi:hypothetical protein